MLAKVWKKALFIILIVAILVDLTVKIIQRESIKTEIQSSVNYFVENKDRIISSDDFEDEE